MRPFAVAIARCVALLLLTAAATRAQAPWKPVPGHIMTRWAEDVSPDHPLPEYPRPMMVRDRWECLNGLWDYAITPTAAAAPTTYDGQILVPFPLESALSGVAEALKPDQQLWYHRKIAIPRDWTGQRILLHCGAVDWNAEVFINGTKAGEHTGGYDPFSFDITDHLKPGAEQELVIAVTDPTDSAGQPRGKQVLKPEGIFYTGTSGIWQTVWLEPVPTASIVSLRCTPDVPGSKLILTIAVSQGGQGRSVLVEALTGDKVIATTTGAVGARIELPIPSPRLWSPDDPFLYDLRISLLGNGETFDEVTSYFGMREIRVAKDAAGINRLMLNGQPIFMFGPLDQGFWPDGLYTAPTDEALRFDVEAVKKMGGNMLRKHVKVEPQRLYSWCDKLGIMVWQDMPSGNNPAASPTARPNFEDELGRMMDSLHNHPSIVMWVPFNEGWGQYDTERVVAAVKKRDPSRLVNNASGWTDKGVGDVVDMHNYPGPGMPPTEPGRASVLGEFGGLGLPVKDHLWLDKGGWGYVSYKNTTELTDAYVGLIEKLRPLAAQGLCAAVYTQTTDCEIEVNGWLTYDRAVFKIDPSRAAAAATKLHGPLPTIRAVVPTAREQKLPWRYTTTKPVDGWESPGFDDSPWKEGPGGFGTPGTPGAAIGTAWDTTDIWIRRAFVLPDGVKDPQLVVHHDEDAEVYVNGQQVADLKGYTTSYELVPLADHAAALKAGQNTIAIHCHQTRGGQYVDAGISEVIEPGPAGRPRTEKASDYNGRDVRGFDVRVNRELSEGDPSLLERVLTHLAADLDDVEHMVPPAAMTELRKTRIWVERQGNKASAYGGHGLCCHWSKGWLREHGILEEKAGGVEIINPTDYLTWRRDQPFMLFHELAHAYQWRLPGLDAQIDAAYRTAMRGHLYDAVARNSVPAGKPVKAYAATDSHEYFAELSEAYFALNDFYPYTRAQLAAHDPEGLKLIERVWNLSPGEIEAARGSRETAGTPAAAGK